MRTQSNLALATLVSVAATTSGCYSTWDLSPQGVVSLNLFREGDAVTVRSSHQEEVVITSDTELTFERRDGLTRAHKFRSIVIDGPRFSGVDKDGSQVAIDLSHLRSVQAKNLSAGKTALLVTSVVAGTGVLIFASAMVVGLTTSIAGRALRIAGRDEPVRGEIKLDPRVHRGGRAPAMRHANAATRARVFSHWAREASTESASVPAFLALARDLQNASAPSALVQAALRAAREEVTHTNLCLGLANTQISQAIDATMPAIPTASDVHVDALLQRLALEAFWDGCVAEGAAAVAAEKSILSADDEATRLALRTIAQDEHEHAQLSQDIVRFCLDAGGRRVRDALFESYERNRHAEEVALSSPSDTMEIDSSIDEDFLTDHGVPTDRVQNAARIETWERSVGMLASA